MKNSNRYLFPFLIVLVFLTSCEQDYMPKQRGYIRIHLPECKYIERDYKDKFTYQMSSASVVKNDTTIKKENWFNIEYPQLKGRLHFSYIHVDSNAYKYEEDARTLVNKHLDKASGIEEEEIIIKKRNIYAIIFDINGTKAASPLQFYATDRRRNFIRGSLYFDVTPNNDSIAPIIKFIRKDITNFIQTLNWKES